jgi:hypothetical protein
MGYKIHDSYVAITMELVAWAQQEVVSLHLLFFSSKFEFVFP